MGLSNIIGTDTVFADPEPLPNCSDAETLAGFDPKGPVPPFEEAAKAAPKLNVGAEFGLLEDFAPKRFVPTFEGGFELKPSNPLKDPEDGRVSLTGSIPNDGVSFGAGVPKIPLGDAIIGCGGNMPPPKPPPPVADAA